MAIKNRTKIKTKSPTALSWFKNVGKSLGYTTTELIEEMIPAPIDFIKSNTETFKNFYNDLRQSKSLSKKLSDQIVKNEYINIGQTAIKNALKDIKSGKIYNKGRQEEIFNDDIDFEFGDDLNIDNDDYKVSSETMSDSSSSPTVNRVVVSSNINKNNPMVKAVERQTEALYNTTQASDKISISLATNHMMINRKLGEDLNRGLSAINDNLSLLVNFQSESMTRYISTTFKYYEESLNLFNNIHSEMKKGVSEEKIVKEKVDPMDSVFLSKGGLNISGYANLIKRQFGAAVDQDMILSQLKYMLSDKDQLKFLAASPISFLSTKIVSAFIPSMLKQTLTSMNKSFENFFPALLMKANRMIGSQNPILNFLGQVFGINVKQKSSVDLSQYEKGAVPFDGYTKKSITEVIPGYLRKILAALNGKEEVAFDYDNGVFKSMDSMQKDFQSTMNRSILSSFSDVISEIKDKANAFNIQNDEERKKFNKDLETFFLKLPGLNKLINPVRTKDRNGVNINELKDVHDFGSEEMNNFFRQLVLSLDKGDIQKMFGTDVLNARKNKEKIFNEAETNPLRYNAALVNNQLNFDDHIKRNKYNRGQFEVKKGFGVLSKTDQFNKIDLDYLRDIKEILLKGIKVFPITQLINPDGTITQPNFNYHERQLRRMETERRERDRKFKVKKQQDTEITPELERINRQQGRRILNRLSDSDISPEEMRDQIRIFDEQRRSDSERDRRQQSGWLSSFISGDMQTKYNLLREKVRDIFNTPAKLLNTVFKKIDDSMFKIIFGDEEGGGTTSFLSRTWALMQSKFQTMSEWFKDKIFTPIRESLFGPNGFITKLKDSDFFKGIKSNFGKLTDFLFGLKDSTGKRKGGIFSDTANNLLDIFDGAKYYFTGRAYINRSGVSFPSNNKSVFGELKSMFGGFKDTIKSYLFGRRSQDGNIQETGVLSSAVNSIKDGFQNFSDAIFGPRKIGGKDNKNYLIVGDLFKKFKERLPKALSFGILGAGSGLLMGGKLGLLGSLFLPGGPIGGAIVGTTVGFLSQSDRFKDWLFGPKDINNNHIGGFINKKTQEFFKKNKVGIIGGASLGALKSILGFGFLPSFFLPGGPIGGALFGASISMLASSEKFKKFMFGDLQADGNRLGGIAQKIFGKVDKTKAKKMFGNVSAGILGGASIGLITSKFGLLGAALLPGGPLGGALLGAAAGIALSSEKWKKMLFGEFDDETQLRKGGLLGKVINWTNLEVVQPIKIKLQEINLNVKEWFTRSIANPFLNAIDPIKHEIKLMIRSLKDNFVEGWTSFKIFIGDVFEKHVGMPFGKFMEDKVMKPLRGFMSKILGGIGRIVGSIVSAPFKGMEGLSRGLTKKHMQAGLDAYVEEGWNDLLDFKGRRQRGEKIGFFGGLKKFKDIYFNRQARDNARNSSQGAPYARQLEIDRQRREDEANVEFGAKREDIRKMWSAWKDRKRAGINNNYDNFSPDGKVVREQYLSPEERRVEQMTSNPINDTTYNINSRTGRRRRGRPNPKPVNDQSVIILPGSVQQGDTTIVDDVTNVINNRNGSRRRGKKSTTTSSINQPIINQQQTQDTSIIQPTISQSQQPTKKTSTRRIKSKDELIIQIAGDVRTIAKEVNGQLDGVGGNVYKIRKLIQSQQGISDEDLSGSSNRDRVGFFGKVRRMLYKPIDTIKEKVMGSIQFVTDKITSVGKKIFDFSKTILVTIPKQIFSTMYNIGSEILSIGKETFLTIVKLPGQLLNLFAQTTKIFAESLKMVVPAIGETLKGVAKLFSGAMGMVSEAMIGVGKGIGQVAFSIGEVIGSTLSAFTKSIMNIVPVVGDFLLTSSKMIMDFGFGIIKNVGSLLTSVTKSLFSIATSPLRFAADMLGRAVGVNRSEMYITGGIIDVVKKIGDTSSDFTQSPKSNRNNLFNNSDNIVIPVRVDGITSVRIVGLDKPVPVYFNMNTNQNQRRISSSNIPGLNNIGNNGNYLTSSLINALDIFDTQNDEEENNKQAEKDRQKELYQNQLQVSRKTSGFLIAQNTLRNEKEFTRNNEIRQTSLLQNIADTSKGHYDSWLSIFGVKGALTTALLLALPFLKDIIQWVKNNFPFGGSNSGIVDKALGLIEKNDTSRNDVDENGVATKKIINAQGRESYIKGSGILIRRNGPKILESLSKGKDKFVNSSIVKNISKYSSDLKNKFFSSGRTGVIDASFRVIDDTGRIVREVTVNDSNKIIQAIKNTFEKFFNNAFVREKLGSSASKIASKIIGVVTKVFNYKTIINHMGKLSKAFLRTGAIVFAAPVIITWDLATGAYEASRIFRVRNESVDEKMRIASSITKSLIGFFPVIDIISEIFNEQTGMSLKQYVATTIYSTLASSEELNKLELNKKVFEDDKNKYNEENGTELSLNAYNDRQNKTFFQKFISNPLSKTKDFLSKNWDDSKKQWNVGKNFALRTGHNIGTSLSKNWDSFKGGFSRGFNMMGNDISGAFFNTNERLKTIKNSLSKNWEDLQENSNKQWVNMKGFVSKSLTDTNNTLGKLFGYKDEEGNDVSFTEGFNIGFKGIIKGIRDSWKEIADGAKFYWDNTKAFTEKKWKELTEKLPKAFESLDNWLGELLGFKDKDGNNLSLSDYANNKISGIKKYFSKDGYNGSSSFFSGRGGNGNGGFGEEPNKLNNFKYYSQYDDRWGNSTYDLSSGHSVHPTISARGCGPTSMAMVVSQLTGKQYEPPQMAKLAQEGGYSTNDGTTWGYFDRVARDFSLNKETINPSNMLNYINKGMPVILSGKRDTYSLNESPFTPGGHFVVAVGRDDKGNVLINDPRGSKFSKPYDFNKITKEARQGWAFSYNGGVLPPNIVSSTNSNIISEQKQLSVMDLFTKMSEAFTIYNENVMLGTNKKLSWDDIEGTSNDFNVSISTSESSSLSNFIPKNLQEVILKKTLELSIGSESSGDYTSSNNDTNASTGRRISPSVGILQWRGNNAKSLMQRMYEQLPGNSEANYFANQVDWGNQNPWNDSQRARLKKFLGDNMSISQKVQNEMALSHIRDTNLAPVYKYGVDTNKIKDPRTIAFLADFANTGPALIKPFLEKYNPNNGGMSEFEHFLNEFKNKSYWGNKGIYANRINNTYSKLSGWKPEFGGNGDFCLSCNSKSLPGGFGEDNSIILNNKVNLERFTGGLGDLTTSISNKYKGEAIKYNRNIFESVNSGMGDYISTSSNTQSSNISMDEIVNVLKEIAINTNTTSKGISEIAAKEMTVTVNNNPTTSDTDRVNNINVNSQQHKNTFVSPFFQSLNEGNGVGNNKEQRDYTTAKKIARGR